jgi:hypothetical protein
MIQNPYPPPKDALDRQGCRFQTYLTGEDKGLLSSLRPIRGTPQAVINHLIKNLCDDLRDLGLTSYRPDADDIFAILIERRPLSAEQVARLRRTSFGATKQVPARLLQYRGGAKVREGFANPPSGPDHAKGKSARDKSQDRKDKTSKSKKSS